MSNYRVSPPKHEIPEFIRNFYNKYITNDFLVKLAKWAAKEFMECLRFYAAKMDLKKWLSVQKTLTPAHVLASHPDFVNILKSTSMSQWRQTDRNVAEMFSDAYRIWSENNRSRNLMLGA